MRFNASLFYSDYKDIQFAVVRADPDSFAPISIMDNVSKARVKGFEVDIVAAPASGLTLTVGIGYTDAEYTEVDSTSDITADSKFDKVPTWTVALSGEYVVPLDGLGELIGRLDYAYKTKVYHDVANTPLITQDGYGLLNARLTFESTGDNWSISVFGTNLTDKRYIVAGGDSLAIGFADVQYARPREWGASLKYNF